MEEIKENKKINYFMILIIISCLVVIFSAFYFYFFKKDFDFIVEVPCNTEEEQCFIRSCDFIECPPNNLSSFKRYSLKARDFKFCENENCELACETNLINCELIPCEENLEFSESCSAPISIENLNNTNEE
jgi:hypothetical protein